MLVATLLAVAPLAAFAQNLVSLNPSSLERVVGQTASLDLEIDFTDPSLGGGIVVEFDTSRLDFRSFSFDPSSPDDPALRLLCPSAAAACASFPGPGLLLAFAVDTISFPAISGAHVIGTLEFDATFTGSAALTTREDDSVAGPLVGVTSFAPPTLGSATVTIATPPGAPGLGVGAAGLLAAGLALAGVSALRAPRADGRGSA